MRRPEKADPNSNQKASVAERHGRLLAVAVVLLLASVAIFVFRPDPGETGSGDLVRFTIPEGAARKVEQGKELPGVPRQIRGSVGDVLVIDNRDSTTQVVAGYPISPKQKLKIPLNRAGEWSTNCSAHPDDRLKMVIKP